MKLLLLAAALFAALLALAAVAMADQHCTTVCHWNEFLQRQICDTDCWWD
jgi:hypothetical protein